jgi:hypothetical protein
MRKLELFMLFASVIFNKGAILNLMKNKNKIFLLTIYPLALYNLFFDNPIFSSPFERHQDEARGVHIHSRHTTDKIIMMTMMVKIGNNISKVELLLLMCKVYVYFYCSKFSEERSGKKFLFTPSFFAKSADVCK